MCANTVRIGARALRNWSCARTVVKSEAIYAKCVVTGMSGGRIDAIYAETFATTGTTGAMRATSRTRPGKRGKGKG
jgi:hypothetical protein